MIPILVFVQMLTSLPVRRRIVLTGTPIQVYIYLMYSANLKLRNSLMILERFARVLFHCGVL